MENIKVSESTIRRRLRAKGFFGGIARKRPMISKVNKAKRLEFAKQHLNKPESFWRRIIWSDESKFELTNTKRRVRVWKKRNEGLNDENSVPTIKHSPYVMVWGCASSSGVGKLVQINGRMDGKDYVQILENNLKQSAQQMGLNRGYIFQQDNDPKHTCSVATKWFADKRIPMLKWPPQSPDLNIIEHLWDHLDRSVPTDQRKSMSQFRNALFECWRTITPQVIDNLVKSMPRRLEAVIKSKGGNTDY